jgi:hypothetical protein
MTTAGTFIIMDLHWIRRREKIVSLACKVARTVTGP